MKIILGALKAFLGLILILFLLGLFSTLTRHSSNQTKNEPRYSEAWNDYPTKQISMTLAQANAQGCACYDYKQEKTGGTEFLVRCGCDPSEYKYYTVWTGINEVMGPYSNENETP